MTLTPEQRNAAVERVKKVIESRPHTSPKDFETYVQRGGATAMPSTEDNADSFARNAAMFGKQGIPVNYRYAERLDPSRAGVPRASYIRLPTGTEHLPISDRAAAGLAGEFETAVADSIGKTDFKYARAELETAMKHLGERDWRAAVAHTANAYISGGEMFRGTARQTLEHILDDVRNYHHFSPSDAIYQIEINGSGPITVPASLSAVDRSFYQHELVMQSPRKRKLKQVRK